MSEYKSKCAVCGRDIEHVVRQTYGGHEYHFCCENCRIEFLKAPDRYEREHSGAIKCAVCGDFVSDETAAEQEHREEGSDEKYYFCSEKHRIEFITDPATYKGMSGRHISQ